MILVKKGDVDLYYGLRDNNPVFYCAVKLFRDGVQVGNLRSTERGFTYVFYKYLINKTGNPFYSDFSQTPDSKRLWNNLSKDSNFKVTAVDINTGKEYPVRAGRNQVESGIKIYDKPGQQKSICLKLSSNMVTK